MAGGCGDSDPVRRLPDAPPPPDSNDPGPVSLEILDGTEPRVGIRVIFQDADSTVVLDTTTGTDGKASATMKPGGFVTAIDPFPGRAGGIATNDLRTFAGVAPGDQLRLVESPLTPPPSVNVTFVLPIENAASEYRISTNCFLGFGVSAPGSGAQPTATIQLAGCGATTNVLVEALDASFVPVSSFFKPSVALTDGATIDLTSDTYSAIPDVTFEYANVPPGIGFVNLYTVRATALGKIFETFNETGIDGGAGSITTKIPAVSDATAINASTFFGTQTQHVLTQWGPPASSYTIDAGAAFLPDYTSFPQLDPSNHRIVWSTAGNPRQPDFVLVTAHLFRESPVQAWRWQIVGPATANAVVLPVLPEASPFNPLASDQVDFIDVSAGKVPGGYDAVRANVLAAATFPELVVGPSGSAAFSFLVEGKPTFRTGARTNGRPAFTPRAR